MKIKLSIIMLFSLSICSLYGCKKNETTKEDTVDSKINVKFNLLGTDSQNVMPLKMSTKMFTTATQSQSIPFDKEYSIKATLEQVSDGLLSNTMAVTGLAATVTQQLQNNAKYFVEVYDANGNKVTSKSFIYRKGITDGLSLDAGKTYTFHFSSFNSTEREPTVKAFQKLSTAYISIYTGDPTYMSCKKNLRIEAGKTYNLDVVLKHHFALVTTTIDASAIGNITKATGVKFKPATDHASVYLDGNHKDWFRDLTVGSLINFNNLNKSVISSSPTNILGEATDNGTLNIGSMTIGNVTKSNINFSKFSIRPGAKYNLKLTLESSAPHVSECGGDIYWSANSNNLTGPINIPYKGGNGFKLPKVMVGTMLNSNPNSYYWALYDFYIPETILSPNGGYLVARSEFIAVDFPARYPYPALGGKGKFTLQIGDKKCVYTVHRQNITGGYD